MICHIAMIDDIVTLAGIALEIVTMALDNKMAAISATTMMAKV